jgi:hypothetical protein
MTGVIIRPAIPMFGVGLFLGEVFRESVEKLHLGSDKNVFLPLLKAVGTSVALIFLLFVMLGF